MDAASLIERLVRLEQSTCAAGKFDIRDLVIETQDCILRMQEEILRLRRENLKLQEPVDPRRCASACNKRTAPVSLSPKRFVA